MASYCQTWQKAKVFKDQQQLCTSSAVKKREKIDQASSPSCKKNNNNNKKSSVCLHCVWQQSFHVGEVAYKCLHHKKVSLRSCELLKHPHQSTPQRKSAESWALLVLVLREWCANNATAANRACSILSWLCSLVCLPHGWLGDSNIQVARVAPCICIPTDLNQGCKMMNFLCTQGFCLWNCSALRPPPHQLWHVRWGWARHSQTGLCLAPDGCPRNAALASPSRKRIWKLEHWQYFLQMTITWVPSCKPFQLNYSSEQ